MNLAAARLVLAAGFFMGGILLLSVHVFALKIFGQEADSDSVYRRYRRVHYLIYGFLLIIAAIFLVFANIN